VSPRRIFGGSLLVGAGLLALVWGGAELRSESARQSGTASRPRHTALAVAELVRQLESPLPEERRDAIVRLARLGPAAAPAIPAVIECLHDRNVLVRAQAARTACRIGVSPARSVRILSELLQSPKPQVCALAAMILGELGPSAKDALPELQARLASASEIIRLHAAEAILKIDHDDNDALRELIIALGSDDSDVRYFAVNALGSAAIENEEAVFALERALIDDDPNVAAAAGLNLSRLEEGTYWASADGDESQAFELEQLTADLSHSSSAIRQAAAIHLALSGPAARCASEVLHAQLDDPNLVVRVYAAQALWAIEKNRNDLLPVLVDLLNVETPNVSLAAAYVLGSMRSAAKPALPALHDLLASRENLDQLFVAGMISRIDSQARQAPSILLDGLHDREGDVRYLSAIALAEAPQAFHGRAERELREALTDRNLRVQTAAEVALKQLRARAIEARRELAAALPEVSAEPAEVAAAAPAINPEPAVAARPTTTDIVSTVPAPAPVRERPIAATRQAAVVRCEAVEEKTEKVIHADGEEPVLEGDDSISDSRIILIDSQEGQEEQEEQSAADDPNGGLKPIGNVRATIRMREGSVPQDIAATQIGNLPVPYQGYGARRGWHDWYFGWEPPAVFFKPLYFEDINLERYGIHQGCLQPVVSFGHFFTRCVCLPYKLLVQPPCECIYTLGYERPNNCIPLYCYCKLGFPSYAKWCQKCPCPFGPVCPWNRSEDDVCRTDDDCP
jgi:HEAT repeat protein